MFLWTYLHVSFGYRHFHIVFIYLAVCLALKGEGNGNPLQYPLAWRIPWMEKPGGLQSMGLWRVGHDWATSCSFSLSSIGEGNGNPLQYYCLENPRDGGAWWAAIYGVAQSCTRLMRLSSRSSSSWLLWCANICLCRWLQRIF